MYVRYEKLLDSTELFFFSLNKLSSQYLLDSITACGHGVIFGLIRCSTQKLQDVLWTSVARNLSNFSDGRRGE